MHTILPGIEPYQLHWKVEFEHLAQVLDAALNDLSQSVIIQHIGSTAIPGLVAKPILDIDIIIQDKSLSGDITARLEKLGYLHKGEQGITGRFAFRQSSDYTPKTEANKRWLAHHLYLCYHDSLAVKNHIQFRDALLRDHRLVNEYAQLKMDLVKENGITRERYNQRKTAFIVAVLASLGFDQTELAAISHANK